MTTPFYLGGMTPFRTGWLGPRAVYIDFQSVLTTHVYQLYAGRKLIGTTGRPGDRRLQGQLLQDGAPQVLTILRVPPAHRFTDFGQQLPALPWARYRLEWSASSYPGDATRFEITAGTEPGGDPDPDNIVGVVQCTGDGDYELLLPPLPASGEWNYRITPRDDAEPDGNAGEPTDVSINALVPPPDLDFDADGNRFTPTLDAGELAVAFAYRD